MPHDHYTEHCNHCLRMGVIPPSREWWTRACAQRATPTIPLTNTQYDHDVEREERIGL